MGKRIGLIMIGLDFFSSNKFLVTGSSGFIGTNLVNRLKDLNCYVLGVDKKHPITSNLDVHRNCDLNDLQELIQVIEVFKPTVIIHLAARTDLDGYSLSDYKDNIEVVENLCKAVVGSESCKKVLFASSMLVCEAGYIPQNDIDYCPKTLYGESKVLGENIVNSYKDILPEHLIFRPTSIWGPYFNEPYRNFFDLVLAKKFIRIGSCTSKKTYGYVENTCNQILSLSLPLEFNESVYYIGDEALNANEWSLLIASTAKVKKPFELPFSIIKLASIFGDLLKLFGVKFPLTSFRLNNMMTDNIFNHLPVKDLNAFGQVSIEEGVSKTIKFLNK